MKTAPTSIKFIKLPDVLGASAVIGTQIDNIFPRHIHYSFCIGKVDSGSRAIATERITHIIKANCLFFLNPGIAHSCQSYSEGGHNYRVISIPSETMVWMAARLGQRLGSMPSFINTVTNDKKTLKKFDNFFDHITKRRERIEQEKSLFSLVSDILVRHCRLNSLHTNHRKKALVKKICDYMRRHYADKISLTHLSQMACLSPFYFHKIFVREKGLSPHDYLTKIRIDKSIDLLMDGWRISEVSLATGFTDQSHFTRYFKRHVGITPGKFVIEMQACANVRRLWWNNLS